jgi:hypothetical protein
MIGFTRPIDDLNVTKPEENRLSNLTRTCDEYRMPACRAE